MGTVAFRICWQRCVTALASSMIAARSRSSINPATTCSLRGGRLDSLWLSRTENSSPGDVVPPSRQQDGPRGLSLPRELLELAGQLVQLVHVVGHLFDGVTLVGHGLDRVVEAFLELLEDVEEGVIEPGVAFGEEQPGALAAPAR